MNWQRFIPGDIIIDSYKGRRGEVVFVEPDNMGARRKVWFKNGDGELEFSEHEDVRHQDMDAARRRRFDVWYDEFATTTKFDTSNMVEMLFEAFKTGTQQDL